MGYPGKRASAVIIVSVIAVAASCIHHDDSSRAKGEDDSRWREYAKERYEIERQLELANSDVFHLVLAMSSDRESLIYSTVSRGKGGSQWRSIYLVDSSSGRELRRLKGHSESTQCLAFARDHCRAVSGGMEGDVRLWDLESGKELDHLQGHENHVRAVACSSVEDKAVTGDEDGTILMWSLEHGNLQILNRLIGHSGGIRHKCLTWSSDGKKVLSGSWDGSIRLWDAQTGKTIFTGNPGYGRVVSLALSPDGKRALSSYLNGGQPVILWDVEGQREINRFAVPGTPWSANRLLHTESVAFSPDGHTALFGTSFGSVLWWDLKDWRQICHNVVFRPTEDGDSLADAVYSQDGKYAVAVGCDVDNVGENAKIRWWKLPEGQSVP